jgi:membrane-associated PAP2 superfamily phosphatase
MASYGPFWSASFGTPWHLFVVIIVVMTLMSKIKVVPLDDQLISMALVQENGGKFECGEGCKLDDWCFTTFLARGATTQEE